MDSYKLGTLIGLWISAVLFGAVGWSVKFQPGFDWLAYTIRGIAVVLAIVALIVSLDWVTIKLTWRVRQLSEARVHAAVLIAKNLKGLTDGQTNLVANFQQVNIEMLIDETGPAFFVRCIARNVPFEVVEDYLNESQLVPGYLYPVSAFYNWRDATAIRDLIISKGWAKNDGLKNDKAILIKPLAWIARRFGVVLAVDDRVPVDDLDSIDRIEYKESQEA